MGLGKQKNTLVLRKNSNSNSQILEHIKIYCKEIVVGEIKIANTLLKKIMCAKYHEKNNKEETPTKMA